MFLVVYARVIDNKKKGLNLEGPFYGPESKTMQKAHEVCREIVTGSKDVILIKICDLDEVDYQGAKELASVQFDRTFAQMETARSLCDAPKRKKLKR
jgi:hypothetical protein